MWLSNYIDSDSVKKVQELLNKQGYKLQEDGKGFDRTTRSLQKELKKHGYEGSADGKFGENSRRAFKRWLSENTAPALKSVRHALGMEEAAPAAPREEHTDQPAPAAVREPVKASEIAQPKPLPQSEAKPEIARAPKPFVPQEPQKAQAFHVDNAIANIESRVPASKITSDSACALSVRKALIKGGLKEFASYYPEDAKDYGGFLKRAGFEKVDLSNGYTPQPGDIAVVQPYKGGNPSGHIAMCNQNGSFISDFRQRGGSSRDQGVYPGPGYAASRPHYTVYRHGNREGAMFAANNVYKMDLAAPTQMADQTAKQRQLESVPEKKEPEKKQAYPRYAQAQRQRAHGFAMAMN